MRLFRCFLCLLPWIAALIIFFWLVFVRVPPSGVRSISTPLDGRSPWVNAFLPGQRATGIGRQEGGWIGQRIYDEPVYSTLRLPGVYESVTLGLEFRTKDQPLLELGIVQEPSSDVMIQPVWSEVLATGWRRVEWQGKRGYVRNDQPDSALGEQDMNRLLVWHSSSTVPAYMDEEGMDRVFPVSLRGSYDIQAIPVKGEISFQFQLQDVNRQRQKGTIIFSLNKNGVLLSSEALSLAGSRDARPSDVYTKVLTFKDLEPGVYKLSLVADDDVFTRLIRSSLRHWVIGPRIYFGDRVGYATTTLPGIAWTNSQHLQIDTLHQEGIQEVRLGSASLQIKDLQQKYTLDRLPSERSTGVLFQAPRGDVRIVGDGYFALAPDLLFLPSPRRLTDASRPLEEGIYAVLTPYVAPLSLGDGWYQSSTTQPLPARPGTLRVTFAAPGLRTRGGTVDVRQVHLTYRRPGLSWRSSLDVLWSELASVWRAL